jgi:hypothetical protein
MAEKTVLRNDPWKKLATRKGVRQIGLEGVLSGLAVDGGSAQALKKALLARVTRLTRGA